MADPEQIPGGGQAARAGAFQGARVKSLIHHTEAAFGKGGATADAPLAEMSSNQLAVERTELAAERTLMASDRSLMAWVRTSLSMTSFGFTIYKVLQGFEEIGKTFGHENSPRIVGLMLTGLGTLAMVLGTVEYWYRLKSLRSYHPYPIWRPSFVMAIVMSAIGLLLFGSIIFKAL